MAAALCLNYSVLAKQQQPHQQHDLEIYLNMLKLI